MFDAQESHTIVHLSADYPDAVQAHKTPAVKNLVSSARWARNIVFSLNRTADLRRETICTSENVYSIRYWGLPFGAGLRFFMRRLAHRLLRILAEDHIRVSAIHAHKLTFEGIAAREMAAILDVPYVLTVRGDTDLKVLRYRLDLHTLYREIASSAQSLFYLAPWCQRALSATLDIRKDIDTHILPNIVEPVTSNMGRTHGSNRFLTAFHFHSLRRKNVARLIQAFDRARASNPGLLLDIAGTGTPREIATLQRLIASSRFPGAFRLLGKMDNLALRAVMSDYNAFLLPSYPETFGLVFLESLWAGLPILYAENAGIDGYFKDFKVGIRVNHTSVEDIAAAICELNRNEIMYKEGVLACKLAGDLEMFSSSSVGMRYEAIMRRVVAESRRPA